MILSTEALLVLAFEAPHSYSASLRYYHKTGIMFEKYFICTAVMKKPNSRGFLSKVFVPSKVLMFLLHQCHKDVLGTICNDSMFERDYLIY